MKRLYIVVFLLLACGGYACAQQMGPGMMGPGMGMMWDGWDDRNVFIPERLSRPANQRWVEELKDVLESEKLSKDQYRYDMDKYRVHMPYAMVIPQEDNHIAWITKLFDAYGYSDDELNIVVPRVKENRTLEEAYLYARQLESELIDKYEWLIANAPDAVSRNTLGTILLQTRHHYVMFDHALLMFGHNKIMSKISQKKPNK